MQWLTRKIIPLAIAAAFVFLWTINERVTKLESAEAIKARVANMEAALLPVLIAYGIRSGLAEEGVDISASEPAALSEEPDEASDSGIAPDLAVAPNTGAVDEDEPPTVRAEEWARNQIYEQRALPPKSRKRSRKRE